jgi:predicted membrane chloride channel (bestrophin family)
MNALITIALLAAPFALLGAAIAVLIVHIGNATGGRK